VIIGKLSEKRLQPFQPKEDEMRTVFLWAVGIPIPVIILLYLFHVV
jgi:hypothetical protein